jgi:hypothetical protein
MREVIGRSNIQAILTGARQTIETAVQELMQKTLDDYGAGVVVQQVQLQKVDPPTQVLGHCRSPFPGNGILRSRDSGVEKSNYTQPDRQQRQSARTKARRFGAICMTPGNLCLYGTTWWSWEDSNLQPNDYQPPAPNRDFPVHA